MITRAEVLAALPEWLTVADAAALAGVSGFAIRKHITDGRLAARAERIGWRDVTVVRTADVLAWRDARRGRKG